MQPEFVSFTQLYGISQILYVFYWLKMILHDFIGLRMVVIASEYIVLGSEYVFLQLRFGKDVSDLYFPT